MVKHVLIVDDDPTIQKILSTRLKNEGYKVVCANHGLHGLEKIKEQLPHLIIADVLMPYMDGFQFYRELKKNPQTKDIPVLIITSLKDTQNAFLLVGADAFIPKPFNPTELARRAKQLLNGIKIQSIMMPNEDNQTIKTPKDQNRRLVLLSADIDNLTKSLADKISQEEYQPITAKNAQDLIEKAVRLNPGTILMNVQFGQTSATELINALNEFPEIKSKILLYSYFENENVARNSDINYFYTTFIGDITRESKLPVIYLGAFTQKASKDNLVKMVAQYLNKE